MDVLLHKAGCRWGEAPRGQRVLAEWDQGGAGEDTQLGGHEQQDGQSVLGGKEGEEEGHYEQRRRAEATLLQVVFVLECRLPRLPEAQRALKSAWRKG